MVSSTKVLLETKDSLEHKTVCVVGLGYVGMPLAEAFSKYFKVIGFDINKQKIDHLRHEHNDSKNLQVTTLGNSVRREENQRSGF